jgi:hypothetical protein
MGIHEIAHQIYKTFFAVGDRRSKRAVAHHFGSSGSSVPPAILIEVATNIQRLKFSCFRIS